MTFVNALNVIVGPNDSGKTNVFRAITLASQLINRNQISDIWSIVKPYFHNSNLEKPLEIRIGLIFNEEEIQAFSHFLLFSGLLAISNQDTNESKLRIEVLLAHGKMLFDLLFRNITLIVKVENRRDYPLSIVIRLEVEDKVLFIHDYGRITSSSINIRQYRAMSIADGFLKDLEKQLGIVLKHYFTSNARSPASRYEPDNILNVLFAIFENGENIAIDVSGFSLRDAEPRLENLMGPEQIYLFHSFRNFLEKRVAGIESLNLMDLVAVIFNSSVIGVSNTRCNPSTILIKNITSPVRVQTEITGEELPAILFRLRNTDNAEDRGSLSELRRLFKELTGWEFDVLFHNRIVQKTRQSFSTLPISSVSNHFYGTGNRDLVTVGDETVSENEQEVVISFMKDNLAIPVRLAAAGLFEVLFLLTILVGKREKVILLDEPALNLHPNMQRRILEILNKYAIRKNKNQVILTTHSPYLINTDDLERMRRLSLSTGRQTRIVSIHNVISKFGDRDRRQILRHFGSAEVRGFLFSRGVILVEGISDRLVLDLLDNRLSQDGKGADLQDKEWLIIDIGGKDSLRIFMDMAKELEIPFVIIMDSDALRECKKTITVGPNQVRTSTIFDALLLTKALSQSEVNTLVHLEKDGKIVMSLDKKGNKRFWYRDDTKVTSRLTSMALRHKVFVFQKDLESALRISKTDRKRKPLQDIETIVKQVEKGDIPVELVSLTNFMKKHCK